MFYLLKLLSKQYGKRDKKIFYFVENFFKKDFLSFFSLNICAIDHLQRRLKRNE